MLQILDAFDTVFVQEKLAQVGVLVYILNLADLVVREVNPFESSWWVKVQHFGELVAGSIQLQEVLQATEGCQGGETVTRQIDRLQVNKLLNTLLKY